MLFTVKQDLELCKKFKLNPRQLMFMKILVPNRTVSAKEASLESYALSLQFEQEIKCNFQEIADLVDRGLVIDRSNGKPASFDYYDIHPQFVNKFELAIYGMPQQLFDAYPKFFLGKEGQRFVGRSAGPEEIALSYLKAIGNNEVEHQRVLEDVAWAVKNSAINVGLDKFVKTRNWEAIREVRLKAKPVSEVKIG
jgi:hypothetical protein